MRDFDMHHPRRSFCRHRFAKPVLLCALLFIALGLLVMLLWNAVLPAVLGVQEIGFWQSIGLLALCRILFGGLGFRPGMFEKAHRRMHERWMKMTPEQREAFMQHRRHKFGFAHPERGHCRSRREESKGNQPEAGQETPVKKPDAE